SAELTDDQSAHVAAPELPFGTRLHCSKGTVVTRGVDRELPTTVHAESLPDDADPGEVARRMTEFFGPRVPGQLGCVFDHSAKDLVVGHIDVTENLIAGTGFLFAPAVVALADTCAALGCRNNIADDAS